MNLTVGETMSRLVEVVTELSEDPQVHVAVFTSSKPGYFFNHFDLGRAADFAPPSDPEAAPAWTELVVRLSAAPYISIASIRGRTRGGGDGGPARGAAVSRRRQIGRKITCRS